MSYKKIKTELQAKTELYNHYKELYEIGIQELKFERIQTDLIKESLEEVKSLANSSVSHALIAKVIENSLERANLDKLIHANLMFK